jgi:hypothetical protein
MARGWRRVEGGGSDDGGGGAHCFFDVSLPTDNPNRTSYVDDGGTTKQPALENVQSSLSTGGFTKG